MLAPKARRRIEELGGRCGAPDAPLVEMLDSITFPHPLYDLDLLDGFISLPDVHRFMTVNARLREDEPDEFRDRVYELLEADCQGAVFESARFIEVAEFVELSTMTESDVRRFVRTDNPELTRFFIFARGGFAGEVYLVYVDDADPADPLVYPHHFEDVYNTDFHELACEGTLSEVLDSFLVYDKVVDELARQRDRWDRLQAERASD